MNVRTIRRDAKSYIPPSDTAGLWILRLDRITAEGSEITEWRFGHFTFP